ncbi:MAG: PaaI family thioesterase [Pseudolabrys sp.]
MADDIEARVRGSFAQQTLMRTLGAEILSVRPGAVEIVLPFAEHILQQHGFVHAAAVAAIADNACGYAALTTMPPDTAVLTVEFKINLLSPAKGERMRAAGRVVRTGRNLVITAADVFAESGGESKPVALMTATMMVVKGDTGLKN